MRSRVYNKKKGKENMLVGKLGPGSRLQWNSLFASCLCMERSVTVYAGCERGGTGEEKEKLFRNFRGSCKRFKELLS